MGRTAGTWEQDTAFQDGLIFVPLKPGDLTTNTGGSATWTRNAKGNVGTLLAAGTTAVWDVPLTELLFRVGLSDDAQEQFGNNAGLPGAQGQVNTTQPFQTPYGISGRPPYAAGANLIPPTSRPKGVAIRKLIAVYESLTDDLTTLEIGLSATTYVNAMALAISDILAFGANGLVKTAAATPYVTPIVVNTTNPPMIVTPNTELILELAATTAAGTAFMYGVFVGIAFNFN